MEDFKAVILLF